MWAIISKKLKDIIGLELIDIFYQPTRGILDDNILVLNFGYSKDEILYSLHIACFARAIRRHNILFTRSFILGITICIFLGIILAGLSQINFIWLKGSGRI